MISRLSVSLLLLLGLSLTTLPQDSKPEEEIVSSEERFAEHFNKVPCKNKERLPAVRALFQEMGASPDALSVVKAGSAENLVVTLPGKESGQVVIGAHYDLIEPGCGAVDNWTGIVTLAHLYRTISRVERHKSHVFVAFGKEELGLIGSGAMAKAIPKTELINYCAMINIDSLGMGKPFAMENVSTNKLMALVTRLAESLKIPFYNVAILNADTDSSSFRGRGIPSVTISGLSADWMNVLHTKKDQPPEVNILSVYLGYRLALATAADVDSRPCGEYAEISR